MLQNSINFLVVHIFLGHYIQFIILTHTLVTPDHYYQLRPIIPVIQYFYLEGQNVSNFDVAQIEPNTNPPTKSVFPSVLYKFNKYNHHSSKTGLCQLSQILFFLLSTFNKAKVRVIF